MYNIEKNKIIFGNSFLISDIDNFIDDLKKCGTNISAVQIDLSEVDIFDNSILAVVNSLIKKKYRFSLSEKLAAEIEIFDKLISFNEKEDVVTSGFENLVIKFNDFISQIISFVVLSADIFFYSIRSIFRKSGRRKGSIYEQILLMGNNAVPIVFLLAFLIGLILSLQSAAQLRQFGANIYLVDLIVISMITEMGPMITAIIVAGRSGSAIAAEISTMQITEELDALKVMALNPLKYVVAPKMIAMTISLPILTVFANIIGILGGFLIAVLYLGVCVRNSICSVKEAMGINSRTVSKEDQRKLKRVFQVQRGADFAEFGPTEPKLNNPGFRNLAYLASGLGRTGARNLFTGSEV